jgi:hypothetical protein
MKRIGLHPSNTGEPGGRETGEHMSDYIVEGNPYAARITERLGEAKTQLVPAPDIDFANAADAVVKAIEHDGGKAI